MDGFENKKTSDWKMPFDDFINKGRGVKSSPKEESNNSMKTQDARTS